MAATSLDDRITALATMSPAQLRDAWIHTYGETPSPSSTALIRHALAYHMQEQAHGGLPTATQRMLEGAGARASPVKRAISLKPGTRLLREWNGTIHAVLVTDQGLVFNERCYASLSQIAKEITGAHWSGPRFFGLKRPVTPPPRGSHAHG